MLPFSERHVEDFERRHCYDRYWDDSAEGGTRYLCSSESLVVVAGARDRYVVGMNVLAAHEAPRSTKVAYLVLVLVPTTVLTGWSIARSRRLSDFLEALSDERLPARAKLAALADVWRRRRRPPSLAPR